MNFLRSFQTKEQYKASVVAENDGGSYSDGDEFSDYENSSKTAVEMENILGHALALTERSNGSIHSLERSGLNSAIEIGRRIGSMHSREEMGIPNAHLSRSDSFSNLSRSSSLGSVESLPTFVRVEREDSLFVSQPAWENFIDHEEKEDEQANRPKTSNRSWNKLRREVYEETKGASQYEDEISPQRTRSIGRRALGFPKKMLRDSRNILRGDTLEKRNRSDPNNKNEEIRKGYAKDYDVEVTLQTKKTFWERTPSLKSFGKGKKSAVAALSRSKRGRNNGKNRDKSSKQGDQVDMDVNNSFGTAQPFFLDGDFVHLALILIVLKFFVFATGSSATDGSEPI